MTIRQVGWVSLVIAAVVLAYALRARPVRGGAAPLQTAPSSVKPDSERAEWETGLGDLSTTNPAAFADLIRQVTWRTECALARLGFAPGPLDGTLDPQTQEAIRQYERSRRLPVTGDPLSFATMTQVIADDDAMDRAPVLLPAFAFADTSWSDGHVAARGTWRSSDTSTDTADQATSIDCDRRAERCMATTALVMATEGAARALSLTTSTYEIDTWSADAIATRPDRDHVRLRLVRSTRSVVEEQAQEGSVTRRRELTNGAAGYIAQFRDRQQARANLLALNTQTRQWLSKR